MPLTRYPMIYNDVRMCSVSCPKPVLLFAWITSFTFSYRNLDFEEQICYAQHSYLFSYINNCDYACTWMASLKGKRSDSKTKLKALFFSSRKPGFWIHKLELECKLQIFHHLFLFLRYRRLWPFSLRKRCNLSRRSK